MFGSARTESPRATTVTCSEQTCFSPSTGTWQWAEIHAWTPVRRLTDSPAGSETMMIVRQGFCRVTSPSISLTSRASASVSTLTTRVNAQARVTMPSPETSSAAVRHKEDSSASSSATATSRGLSITG